MTVDNKDLYLGFGQSWREVITNNRIPIQREVFVRGLIFVMVVLNLIERILTERSRIGIRTIKTITTVILIYALNWGLFELLDLQIFCLYYYPRGMPAIGMCIGTIMCIGFLLIIIEFLTRTKIFKTYRQLIIKRIPM